MTLHESGRVYTKSSGPMRGLAGIVLAMVVTGTAQRAEALGGVAADNYGTINCAPGQLFVGWNTGVNNLQPITLYGTVQIVQWNAAQGQWAHYAWSHELMGTYFWYDAYTGGTQVNNWLPLDFYILNVQPGYYYATRNWITFDAVNWAGSPYWSQVPDSPTTLAKGGQTYCRT